jgi:UPF0148 protein
VITLNQPAAIIDVSFGFKPYKQRSRETFEESPLSRNSNGVKSMAELLRAGATMTDLSCPACSSPLFRLKTGDIWCGKCQKKVVVVKEDEQIEKHQTLTSLGEVESVLLTKILEINERIQGERDLGELQKLSSVLTTLLDNLDKVKRLGR